MQLHTEISGHGPMVGMIHGWGLHGGIWGPAQALLERHYRLVRVDLPGHGQSDRERSRFDLEEAVEEVGRVLPWRCHVLGWSLGATIALRFALEYPDRYLRPNEIGWQDQVYIRVSHDYALLPGPGRLLARRAESPATGYDPVPDEIEYRNGVYVRTLAATARLGNEGQKPSRPYVQSLPWLP